MSDIPSKPTDESGHTPGPWVAKIQSNKHHADLGWIIEHQNGRIGWASLAYADANQEAEKSDPARGANARLIAAAPDMLAALRSACSSNPDWELITSAIAKAEGRS